MSHETTGPMEQNTQRVLCIAVWSCAFVAMSQPAVGQKFAAPPAGYLLPAYNLVNARVGVTRDKWDLSLYGNNLTDEIAWLALDQERGTRARVGYLTNPPRSFGLTLRAKF